MTPGLPAPASARPAFDDAVLGRDLPDGVGAALAEAGALRGRDAAGAMAALMRARALAPTHPAVLVAFYRHHFYGHRLAAARDIARQALVVGATALALPTLWRDVPARALPDAATNAAVRFYLFALKGYAYLSLRLGDAIEARAALRVLRTLDPADAVGAGLLLGVLQRAGRGGEDDEDDDEADDQFMPRSSPRGWPAEAHHG